MTDHDEDSGVMIDGPAPVEWLLAFDTSTPVAVVVCGRMDEVEPRAAFSLGAGANQASEGLVEHLVATVRAAGITMAQVGGIAVGRGPGTFTGTRVALATAKGLARGRSLPLHPISTLACVAASIPSLDPPAPAALIAVLDARKGEVYVEHFTQALAGVQDAAWAMPPVARPWTPRGTARCVAPDQLVAQLAGEPEVLVVGPGVAPHATSWPDRWRTLATEGPSPLGVWRVAAATVRQGGAVLAGAIDATYLRASYAELGINVPKRGVWQNPALLGEPTATPPKR
jgi:tRNA threonylcarbamoyl adenosine modification protein YeaZ